MLKSVFFRRLVIMLSVAMLIAAAVMLGGYVFLSKDVYADIKLDELHPSLDAAEQLAKEYMAGTAGGKAAAVQYRHGALP